MDDKELKNCEFDFKFMTTRKTVEKQIQENGLKLIAEVRRLKLFEDKLPFEVKETCVRLLKENKHLKMSVDSLINERSSLNKGISKLDKENERLKTCLKLAEKARDEHFKQAEWARSEIERLKEELSYRPTSEAYELACKALWKHRDHKQQLIKALKFYADENSYVTYVALQEIEPTVMIDKGDMARQTLQKVKGEE